MEPEDAEPCAHYPCETGPSGTRAATLHRQRERLGERRSLPSVLGLEGGSRRTWARPL